MNDDSYILRLLDECREEIRVSDSKASIIFAAVATATGLLASMLLDKDATLRTSGGAVLTFALLAIATLIAAMLLLGLAVTPRVGKPEQGRARYFEEQAQFETPQALLAAISVDSEISNERHAQQLLTLARIARRKYNHLRRAMWAVLVAIAVMAIAVAISAF